MSSSTPAKDGAQRPDGTQYETVLSEEQWRERLSPDAYHVLREAGTEPAYQGEFTDEKRTGSYSCRACGSELFTSETKFDSQCGWPSFYEPLAKDSVVYLEDKSTGRTRTEVRCAACGGHLGHVFEGEGFGTPTDLRYCINSISVNFETP
jgi:peptide-methionine (R)-S-oxide reductase